MNSYKSNSKLILLLTLLLAVFESQGQSTETIQSDTEVKERPFQISFVPGFGTSKGPKEGYTNQFSVNIFAGYEHSFDGAELGDTVQHQQSQHIRRSVLRFWKYRWRKCERSTIQRILKYGEWKSQRGCNMLVFSM